MLPIRPPSANDSSDEPNALLHRGLAMDKAERPTQPVALDNGRGYRPVGNVQWAGMVDRSGVPSKILGPAAEHAA